LLHSGVREEMTVSQSNVMLLAVGFEHVWYFLFHPSDWKSAGFLIL
jgi:hypothetical protein